MPKLQNRLTDRTLRHLNPDTLKAYDLADGGDLYVRVESSGTRVFWLRYQHQRQTAPPRPWALRR